MSIANKRTPAAWARNGWSGVRSGTQRMGQSAGAAWQQVGRPKRSAQAYHMAANRPTGLEADRTKLRMSDYWFLAGMLLTLLWAVDPMLWHMDQIPVIKHFPFLVLGVPLMLTAAGGMLRLTNQRDFAAPFLGSASVHRYLLGFAVFVVCGSLVAKYGLGIGETFLTMGFFALAAPLGTWLILSSHNPAKVLRALSGLFAFCALVGMAAQLAQFGKQMIHNKEHLALVAATVFLVYGRNPFVALLAIALATATSIGGGKNTGHLVVLLTLGYLVSVKLWRAWRKVRNPAARGAIGTLSILVIGALGVAGVVGYKLAQPYLATGNPKYRLHTYELAINKFLASPIWGQGFTKAAVERFDLFQVAVSTQVLPTHSDPLDIAANGGVIGLLLWLLAIGAPIWMCWKYRAAIAVRPVADQRSLHIFIAVVLAGVVACSFNPILNFPNQAWCFWMAVGGIATHAMLARQASKPSALKST